MDLVSKLRLVSKGELILLGQPGTVTGSVLASEAADEIERLRYGLQVLATTFYKEDQHQDYAKHILGLPKERGE